MDKPLSIVFVWSILLALLGLSVASAYVDLGLGNVVANVGIAAIKASLVAWFYMHLNRSGLVVRAAALIGVLWLMLLIGLSLADNLTRVEISRLDHRLVGGECVSPPLIDPKKYKKA